MDNRLVNFLVERQVERGQPFTHTSKITPMRRYYIEDNDLDTFYEIYNQVIFEGGIAGITEKPEPVVPLIVDIDLKCNMEKGLVRHYKPQHVREIVSIYQEIIEEITENPTEKMFYCCVLEKKSPILYQNKCKDGFHLHFPYYFTEHWVQREHIREQVVKRVQERKIFDDIPLVESIEKVFDKNIPNVCWLMYGSRKEPRLEPYILTKTYTKDLDTIARNSVFRNKYKGVSKQWNLPRYFSIRQGVEPTPLKPGLDLQQPAPRKMRQREYNRDLDAIISDLVVAEQLVDMLDTERADDFSLWMEVGWILYNISEGHPKGLDLWSTFSARSEKFQEGVCAKKWDQMEMRNCTMASLKALAYKDSPNEYNAWKDTQVNHILLQGISAADNDIAKIMHIMFENQFICADPEKEIWYEFRGHRWVKSTKGINLRWHMSHTLANKYAALASRYMGLLQTEEDQAQRTMYNAKSQQICKLIDKLKKNSFKNAVMKEAIEYFYDETFVEKMDENPNLTVFANGVYDAENKIFRDGRPTDYCTKSTKKYYHEFSPDDPKVKELEEIFRKTFVNKKLYRFFRQTSSDLIKGGNRHKIFLIYTGAGDNGKSVIADLLQAAFGEYYYTPPTTMLTGKQQQSSGATAELLPMKGARVVVLSETDNADVLNCGMMKKLTGGDPIYARGLFKDPVKIIPTFGLILHCNKLPNISAEDKASWNRTRVLQYESTFVKTHLAPETSKEQYAKKTFPMDKSLKNRLNKLADVFIWWLIKAYEEIGDADLYEPPEVMEATNEYRKTNDFYIQFMDERIQETGDRKDFITLTQIYTLFKDWYKFSYPGRSCSTRIQVKEAFEKKLGKQVKGVWRGVRTYNPDEEIHNDSDEENENENENDNDPKLVPIATN